MRSRVANTTAAEARTFNCSHESLTIFARRPRSYGAGICSKNFLEEHRGGRAPRTRPVGSIVMADAIVLFESEQ